MTTDKVGEVLAGRLGEFFEWRADRLHEAASSRIGWLAQDGAVVKAITTGAGDAEQHLSALLHPSSVQQPQLEALLGVLQREAVLITDVFGIRATTPGGIQPMIDTVEYRGRNMVVGVNDTDAMRSVRLRRASVVFPDMLHWAGLESLNIDFAHDQDGLVQSSESTVKPLPVIPAGRIRKGLSIDVNTTWSVNPDDEQATISTGLHVQCRASRALPTRDFVSALSWVQFAVVLAHRHWVVARPGRATLDLKRGRKSPEESTFWSGSLMTAPPGANTGKQPRPYYRLADMGNARGLARWIRFCEENTRLVEPLLAFHRNGSASVYDHINAMCSAIEYWAASWKSKSGWGDIVGKPPGGLGKFHVLAARIGPTLPKFVGNVDTWAQHVWEAYLSSKHFRSNKRQYTLQEVHALAASAELLLTAAMLDEASGSRSVSKAMFEHHTLSGLSSQLRTM
jgi:hypothetical protein